LFDCGIYLGNSGGEKSETKENSVVAQKSCSVETPRGWMTSRAAWGVDGV